jgi:hypothetical protein
MHSIVDWLSTFHPDIVTLTGFIAAVLAILGAVVTVVRAVFGWITSRSGWKCVRFSSDMNRGEKYRVFWQSVVKRVPHPRPGTIAGAAECQFATGLGYPFGRVQYMLHFTQRQTYRIELVFYTAEDAWMWEELQQRGDEYWAQHGWRLVFEGGTGNVQRKLNVEYPKPITIDADVADVRQAAEWTIETFPRFRSTFNKELTQLIQRRQPGALVDTSS